MPIKPSPHVPLFLRHAVSQSRPVQLTYSDVSDTNIASTSSFTYDPMNSPLKSSQQLNVDWSRFENHTFFSSAEVNVNEAFDQIINRYPFDGTKADLEKFLEGLTGFEKWVFDGFPRFRGALHFSGSWIEVKDYAGAAYPSISRTTTGESVLNPRSGSSMSIEMQLFVPSQVNDNQIVVQKQSSSTQGFSLYLSASASTGSCDVSFAFVSGTARTVTTGQLVKGQYNHVCAVLDRETGVPQATLYVGEELVDTARLGFTFRDLDIDNVPLTIGSGSSISFGSTGFVPAATLSASIDELRIFHSVRPVDQQLLYAQKPIFSTPDLKLYYRFNEPPPLLGLTANDGVNSIVLDSSGNSLHANVTNFTGSLREDFDDHPENPVIYERSETYPILFPAHEDVLDLNEALLTSASLYDQQNPNIITRLIPEHYLRDGMSFEGFQSIEGTAGNAYAGSGIPGEGVKGGQQLLLSFLYIWAKLFDEIKLFVDSFQTMNYVGYEDYDTMPNDLLPKLAERFGFYIPPLFNGSNVEQYVDGENIGQTISRENYPLRYVQQQLLKRILINMPEIVRSKGTQHSVKAFLRAIGIDPDNSLRIREYGGPTENTLTHSREFKVETSYMAEFYSASSVARSPYLSASRTEVGWPYPSGQMVASNEGPHGVSTQRADGLLTSGSWTVECYVRFPKTATTTMTPIQSIVRLCTTSSLSGSEGLTFNLLAISSSTEPRIDLYGRPGTLSTSPTLLLSLPLSASDSIFNNEKWSVSFGRYRNDEVGSLVSSSYFIRTARADEGVITKQYATASFFQESPGTANVLTAMSATFNASGSFLAIGPGQTLLSGSSSGYLFLNNTSVSSTARTTTFDGRISNLRFWSRALDVRDWQEHVRNYQSAGVVDPLVNYNFTVSESGSFGRLRMDVIGKQQERQADATSSIGSITFFDQSLNGNHVTGSGFAIERNVLVGETFERSFLSPYFDEAVSSDKVRVRGYDDVELLEERPWANIAPVYEVPRSEEPNDDVRFSIDISLIDALNRDIVLVFATLDALDDALGQPNLLFSDDYPDLERMRDIYFQRIQEKVNFRSFFDFFRWFDTSVGTFIEQLIPKKTLFNGINLSVESHMLERHKLAYRSNEAYLGDAERPIRNVLLLQQVAGELRKY